MRAQTAVRGDVKVTGTAEVGDVVIDGDSVKAKLAELEARLAQLEGRTGR